MSGRSAKLGLGLLMSVKGDYKPTPFIEDAAVPVEQLAEYVTRVEQFCHDLGTKVSLLCPRQRRLSAHSPPDQRQTRQRGGQAAAHRLICHGAGG